MTHESNHEPTHSFPTHHVIGVISDMQEAKQAVQALQNAGSAAHGIHLIPSQTLLEGIQERQQQSSRFEQALHVFFTSSDEGFPGDLYVQQAQSGAHVLVVYASTDEQA